MLPAASNASSGWPGGLPSEGWNEHALQSSIVNQTLSLLTAPGLSSTPSSTIPAINPSNTTSTTSTTITSTAKRTSLFDDDDEEGLQGLMDDQGEDDQPKTKGPNNYTDAEMEPFAAMDLESLRAAANHYAVRRRMSHDMKDELDELYYNFQCSVVRSAIRNHIKPHLFAHYLGHSHRINGGMSWNNFQRYDLEARKLFDTCRTDLDSHISKRSACHLMNDIIQSSNLINHRSNSNSAQPSELILDNQPSRINNENRAPAQNLSKSLSKRITESILIDRITLSSRGLNLAFCDSITCADQDQSLLPSLVDRDEARDQVATLWNTKSDEEKLRYRDPAFLDTLRTQGAVQAASNDSQQDAALCLAPNPTTDI
ncbi:hypothetical protein Pst134EA_001156 [Puccinia striiformis f. sp. tritici]|uniref:Uncharacterized protein n=1 Tax=Puccinia striiformis f. sp. tritici PST-78 TaxID=1165861 RepID=A0A0L0V559_9BASI|nr:hypothetical protein Pst134EA_001156 [Puccinia striiformis f. sp. tritici]KAH9474111.1 hypothetical protein Pst134EA_001156 [Puccinia striiformis f. sp. tritici]KNE94408.1 hypothetical protein PSTG_12202 [Puccinia striiformis f. sp. tritici PST-78]